MSNLNLFQIELQYLALAELLINNGGETTDELNEALQINQNDLETKGRAYGYIIKDLENEIDIIDLEIKRISEFKKSRAKTVERLKILLSDAMQLFQIQKIESPTLKINFRKSESVEVADLSLLDEKFKTIKVTVAADKVLIKAAIKAGEAVQGAVLVANHNLQIK